MNKKKKRKYPIVIAYNRKEGKKENMHERKTKRETLSLYIPSRTCVAYEIL